MPTGPAAPSGTISGPVLSGHSPEFAAWLAKDIEERERRQQKLANNGDWGDPDHDIAWLEVNCPACVQAHDGLYAAGAIIMVANDLSHIENIIRDLGSLVPEPQRAKTLYHYTTREGLTAILNSGELNPSLKALNPADARYGNGQYLSDIAPGSVTPAQLSRAFLMNPFQGARFTHFLEINTEDLNVVYGREGVFVVPNEKALDISGRVFSFGSAK
jgi:hypothetical protein